MKYVILLSALLLHCHSLFAGSFSQYLKVVKNGNLVACDRELKKLEKKFQLSISELTEQKLECFTLSGALAPVPSLATVVNEQVPAQLDELIIRKFLASEIAKLKKLRVVPEESRIDLHSRLVVRADKKLQQWYVAELAQVYFLLQRFDLAEQLKNAILFAEPQEALLQGKSRNRSSADLKQRISDYQVFVEQKKYLRAAEVAVSLLKDFPNHLELDEVAGFLFETALDSRFNPVDGYEKIADHFIGQMAKAPLIYRQQWLKSLYWHGSYDDALVLTETLMSDLRKTGLDHELLMIAAQLYWKKGEIKRAQDYLSELVSLSREEAVYARALLMLGLISEQTDDKQKAVYFYEKLIADNAGVDAVTARARLIGLVKDTNIHVKYLTTFKPFSWYSLVSAGVENCSAFLPSVDNASQLAKSKNKWLPHQIARLNLIDALIEDDLKTAAVRAMAPLLELLARHDRLRFIRLANATGDYLSAIKKANQLWDDGTLERNVESLSYAYPRPFSDHVLAASKEFSLPQDLVFSVMRQESSFMEKAVSTSQAYGLMQIIEPTAIEIATKLEIKGFKAQQSLFTPQTNIRMGAFYLRELLDQWSQNLGLAIASYNAGPHRLKRWLDFGKPLFFPSDENMLWVETLPWAETRFYVKAVFRTGVLYGLSSREQRAFTNPFVAASKTDCDVSSAGLESNLDHKNNGNKKRL